MASASGPGHGLEFIAIGPWSGHRANVRFNLNHELVVEVP
jgi:hypothetical protein